MYIDGKAYAAILRVFEDALCGHGCDIYPKSVIRGLGSKYFSEYGFKLFRCSGASVQHVCIHRWPEIEAALPAHEQISSLEDKLAGKPGLAYAIEYPFKNVSHEQFVVYETIDLCNIQKPEAGDSWFINVGRIFKTGSNRKDEIDMLWSPNLESRTMVAPNAMGKLVFR